MANVTREIKRRAIPIGRSIALQMKDGAQNIVLTYADLPHHIAQYRNAMTHLDAKPGDRVVLISENNPTAVVALLAMWDLNLSVVVLDPQTSPDDLKAILQKTDARFAVLSELVAQSSIRKAIKCPIFGLQDRKVDGPIGRSKIDNDGDPNVALILFTSGTTGHQAGVMISHANILSSFPIGGLTFNFKTNGTVVTFLPMYHVFPLVQSIIVPLLGGMKVVLIPRIEGSLIAETILAERPSIICLVPRVLLLFHSNIQRAIDTKPKLQQFIARTELTKHLPRQFRKILFSAMHRRFGGKLESIVVGGSALSTDLENDFHRWGFMVLCGYGLTETTGAVCVNTVAENRPQTVGKLHKSIECRINQPDALGEGEICLRGPVVTPGYFRDPEKTQQAFKDGWFHTGDLGILDRDGFLKITGRIREIMVTIGGKKSSPQEIEDKHQGIVGIEEMAVFGKKSEFHQGDEICCAILLIDELRNKDSTELSEIQKRISGQVRAKSHKLSSHHAIQHIYFVDAIPKTSTLKVRRHKLRADLTGQIDQKGMKREEIL